MKAYRYTGSDEKQFPTLGVTVQPNDIIHTDKDVNHPELELVQAEGWEEQLTNNN